MNDKYRVVFPLFDQHGEVMTANFIGLGINLLY